MHDSCSNIRRQDIDRTCQGYIVAVDPSVWLWLSDSVCLSPPESHLVSASSAYFDVANSASIVELIAVAANKLVAVVVAVISIAMTFRLLELCHLAFH